VQARNESLHVPSLVFDTIDVSAVSTEITTSQTGPAKHTRESVCAGNRLTAAKASARKTAVTCKLDERASCVAIQVFTPAVYCSVM